MIKLKLLAAAGALLALGSVVSVNSAAADPLSPWEKFCLNTQAPGQALGNCLDGLPSSSGPSLLRGLVILKPHDGFAAPTPAPTGQPLAPRMTLR